MEEERPTGVLFKKRDISFFVGLERYIRTRSPGDQFIFFILGLLIIVTSLLGILKLQASVMVTEPAYGGSLTEGDIGEPRFVNPLLAISDTDQDLTALTYAGLMGEGANATLVPVLAQSYSVSPDGKTYTFTLKKNLTFSNGSPLTANDVVFTVQKAEDASLKSPQFANWQGVQAVALDAHTVQFTLPAPYAQFLYDTTLGILPSALWRNVTDDAFPFSTLETTPVGNGPFVVTKVLRDANGTVTRYELSANPHYALGRPYLDSFNFVFYPDQSSLQTAFSAGDIDSAYGVTSKSAITAPYSHVFAVFLNQASGTLFSKLDTREALSIAVNRNEIVQNLLGGYATPLNGPVPSGSGIPDLPLPDTSSNVASAIALLKQAGWKQGSDGSWKNSAGQTLAITLTTSNVPELQALAQAVQSDWTKIGVHTTLQLDEPGDLAQSVIQPRAYQALLFGMVIDKGDDLYDFWDSKETAVPGLNITGYSNPKVDTLLEKLRTETDPHARMQDLAQVNQLISADYPAVFIESPDFVYSVPNDLKGVILSQITAPSDRFATVVNWYRRTESVWPFLLRQRD
jgi:peptide/nickel transport system substrate-binding protein